MASAQAAAPAAPAATPVQPAQPAPAVQPAAPPVAVPSTPPAQPAPPTAAGAQPALSTQPPVPTVQSPEAPSLEGGRTLTLAVALQNARTHQPSLRQARATTDAARARVDQAAAPLYPQVNATLGYQRKTLNYVPGAIPTAVASAANMMPATTTSPRIPSPSFSTVNQFNGGLTVNQLIYDFGQVTGRKHSAEATVEAQEDTERATLLIADLNVRVAFFNARAAKSLLAVANETLGNFERHLLQIEGFVRAGTRAEIDAVQARTDRANAKVSLINAENAYASARAALNQAMGIEGSTDYDVADENVPAISGEDGALDPLLKQGTDARPEFASLDKQVQAQQYTLDSIRGARWPTLGVAAGATEAGKQLDNMVWNVNAGVTMTWPIFQGGITNAQADEVQANLVGLEAQRDILRQQLRVDVEQAQLSVRASKAALEAADEVVTNARERQRLAEGRYQTGVGNGIELADAELALTSALAQRVQSDYNLSLARAQLLAAIGAPQ